MLRTIFILGRKEFAINTQVLLRVAVDLSSATASPPQPLKVNKSDNLIFILTNSVSGFDLSQSSIILISKFIDNIINIYL
jgi:hypothetical protein